MHQQILLYKGNSIMPENTTESICPLCDTPNAQMSSSDYNNGLQIICAGNCGHFYLTHAAHSHLTPEKKAVLAEVAAKAAKQGYRTNIRWNTVDYRIEWDFDQAESPQGRTRE